MNEKNYGSDKYPMQLSYVKLDVFIRPLQMV